MTKSKDTEEIITKDIHNTLERSKNLSDKNPTGGITAEHLHSYEYLILLFGRIRALSNESIKKLTVWIIILTIAVILLDEINLFLII